MASRQQNKPLTAQQQSAYYYMRKRQRERAEATAENGGMRNPRPQMGVHVVVSLKVE